MLMDRHESGLLLVDVQEKLIPYVKYSEHLISRCEWLLRLAKALSVPIFISEQYPNGLGHTVESLRAFVTCATLSAKVHFSCYQGQDFNSQWKEQGRKQIIIAGIETHVCVMQTALDLKMNTNNEVFVVVDAISSRHEVDHQYGLKRMQQAGIQLVTSEMVFFEWVRSAGTPEFKTLSQTFLKNGPER